MILASRNIRCMQTFAGVPLEGGVKQQWVVGDGNFWFAFMSIMFITLFVVISCYIKITYRFGVLRVVCNESSGRRHEHLLQHFNNTVK